MPHYFSFPLAPKDTGVIEVAISFKHVKESNTKRYYTLPSLPNFRLMTQGTSLTTIFYNCFRGVECIYATMKQETTN